MPAPSAITTGLANARLRPLPRHPVHVLEIPTSITIIARQMDSGRPAVAVQGHCGGSLVTESCDLVMDEPRREHQNAIGDPPL